MYGMWNIERNGLYQKWKELKKKKKRIISTRLNERRKGKKSRNLEREKEKEIGDRKAIRKTREHGGLEGYIVELRSKMADNRADNGSNDGKKKEEKKEPGNFIRGVNTNWRQRRILPRRSPRPHFSKSSPLNSARCH